MGTNLGYILPSTSNHHPLLVQSNHWSEWAGCSWRPAGPPPAARDDDDLSSRSQAGSRDRVYDLSLECPEKHSNHNRRWVPSTKSWIPWLHSIKQDTKHITGWSNKARPPFTSHQPEKPWTAKKEPRLYPSQRWRLVGHLWAFYIYKKNVVALKHSKQRYHMIQQSHSWAYTWRKP